MFVLQPLARRLVYVTSFEILAIVLSTGLLMVLSGSDAHGSLPVAVMVSMIAVVWNYVYNLAFETFERRSRRGARTVALRVLHASGFETGLLLLTIPLYMAWYSVGPWEAFKMEVTILAFFLVYTFVFTWLFDTLFALPRADASASPA